jgi:hypothetical protein
VNDTLLLTHDGNGITPRGARGWRWRGDSVAGEVPGKSRILLRTPVSAHPSREMPGTSGERGPFPEAFQKFEIRNPKFEIP